MKLLSFHDYVIKLLGGKRILNIYSFRGDRTLEIQIKIYFKKSIFSQFKTKWSKIRV